MIMKKALVHTGIVSVGLGNIGEFAARNAGSALLWLGILLYASNFFIWIIVLYKIDLSIAMPVGGISYIFIPIAATLFLHEHVSLTRWAAVACIILGVHFVSKCADSAKGEMAKSG